MKKLFVTAAIAASAVVGLSAENKVIFDPKAGEHISIPVELLSEKGNTAIGEVVAVKTAYGVAFYPNLKGLTPGIHGFHVHTNPDCGMNDKGLGMKAGGHFDPKNTGSHSAPWDDNGHFGDLPALAVAPDGTATTPVLAPKIKELSEIKEHSLMIHVGGDNHSDHPKVLGGGGARLACGVIK